ncbi:HAMP domain-containing histidine kinase [Allofrancisella guangzhouensis]|uniref:histidine kinase n=1 Tax=Allofrancisella guangzhouensis TaxID=594679 RepID=A0A0A8E208_9GAMM|nr:HAMP domain-containing sensor histidine kinase [Allofrancisella guangzhouensis]AJC48245.1 ATPase [Allofrancisella guangzhouensis]MBK2027528.1 HAMP domain-containing histidine kinase [Allofrancisella guangzhouensis]MBK2043763.1 HAMP domain-containing histidine kinase [Allofrancisella guangzhouensis]MBK2045265.1 HAMP domain-containing histidine kinase [Allofrancisella guangzhouensis]
MSLNNKKESSILSFLAISFASFFMLLMLIISILGFYQIKYQTDAFSDDQLKITAQMIETILQEYPISDQNDYSKNVLADISKSFGNIKSYNENIGFTIYDRNKKKVILKTNNLPVFKKGYRDISLTVGYEWLYTNKNENHHWYTYTLETDDNKYFITIFSSHHVKDQITRQAFLRLTVLSIVAYIALIIFTYYILHIALQPLKRINKNVSKINPRKNEKLKENIVPHEIKSVVEQINSLIEKFHQTLEREKKFSGDAAHELKTPISGIKTLVEIALSSDDINEIKQKLEKIRSSADRYSHIIDQLLILNRIQPDEQIVFAKKLLVNKVLETFIAENAIKAIEKNIEISFFPCEQKLYCYSNEYLLGILFKNLISNAIKYTKDGGHVEIRSFKKDSNIIVEVKDNGIGVPPENIDRIFDRFYREVGTGEEGSGLGLAIVTEIVRLHNGKIFVKNNTDQKGITITVKIPMDYKLED